MNTDINREGWIGQLPEKYRAYAVLARLDRPIGWWLLLLPGWWGIALAAVNIGALGFYGLFLLVLFLTGAVIMRAAGCVINDIWDRKMDAAVERTSERPLASGEISVENALIFLLMLLMAGFIILLLLPGAAILLGLLSIPLIIAYPLMKRHTYWPQAFLGLTFNFGALMGWAALTGGIGPGAVSLYLAGIFWTLGYDTIYAHQDKEDDMRVGIKSTALLFGDRSKTWVSVFYTVCWIFLALSFFLAHVPFYGYALLFAAGLHLAWQLWRWDMYDSSSSLRVFKSNRDFGLIVLAAILFGYALL